MTYESFLDDVVAHTLSVIDRLGELFQRLAICHNLLLDLRTSGADLSPQDRRLAVHGAICEYQDVIRRSDGLLDSLAVARETMNNGMAQFRALQWSGALLDGVMQRGQECLAGFQAAAATAGRIRLSANSGLMALTRELDQLDLEVECSAITHSLLSRVKAQRDVDG
jgi:hypothetical protein